MTSLQKSECFQPRVQGLTNACIHVHNSAPTWSSAWRWAKLRMWANMICPCWWRRTPSCQRDGIRNTWVSGWTVLKTSGYKRLSGLGENGRMPHMHFGYLELDTEDYCAPCHKSSQIDEEAGTKPACNKVLLCSAHRLWDQNIQMFFWQYKVNFNFFWST